VHLLGMNAVLFWYKLVGGLPYTWPGGPNLKNDTLVTVDTIKDIKRDKLWMVWTLVFGFFIAAYFSYGGLQIMDIFDECATTFTVILKVEDFIGMMTTILLRIHMIGQAKRLADACSRMHILCNTHGFKGNPYYSDKYILTVAGHHLIGFMCICYGNVSMAVAEGTIHYFRIANLFEATVKPLVFNLSMMMYSHLINLQAKIYSQFLDYVAEDDDQTSPIPPQIANWTTSPARMTRGTTRGTTRVNTIIQLPQNTATYPTYTINTDKAKILLFDLYDSHQYIKGYFQFMVGLGLLHSTISSIVSCFLAAIAERKTFPEYVATREELRVVIKRMRHDKRVTHKKDEMGDLLELLEEDPGFDMGGFFTLGRARMVDILSFVATYMVILLQFKVTENKPDNPLCINGTVAVGTLPSE
ncbi:putative 7tm Chemosensory receptor-containing protein 7, partial [Homarus americanus]